MKFWQLVSTTDHNIDLIKAIASSNQNWSEFANWLNQYEALVRTQDRKKLDCVIPDAFVMRVLDQSELVCFLSKDGWLRAWRMSPEDMSISATEAYKRYGGDIIERVFNNGVSAVT